MIRRKATVWTASTYDGYPLVFVWNGSVTVNVFTGLQAESQDNSDLFLEDIVECDVFTLYGENGTLPTADEVASAITEYLNCPDGEDVQGCNNYDPVVIDGLVCEVDGCDNEADVYVDDDLRCSACASNNHGIAEPHEGGWRCMCCYIPLTVMLTDAPVAYDYGPYDTDLGDVSVTYVPLTWFKGKVRSVAVPSGNAARYQFDRYLSGSYTVVTVWPVNV